MKDDPTYQKVARGVAFLDEHIPGWHKRISLKGFDIRCSSACALGQLFPHGGYFQGLKELGIRGDKKNALGFWGSTALEDDRLDEIWKEIIKERQGA